MEPIFILAIIAILTPLAGSFISLLLKKWGLVRDVFGVVTIFTSAVSAIIMYILYDVPKDQPIYWLGKDSAFVSGLYVDSLAVLMALIVSILSMLIAFFSLEYMDHDEHKARYWFFIQFFVSGMLLLVLAQDMIFLFIGWEIVGICSCFLIAHNYMKDGEEGRKPALSGIKALITTGIGDVGLLAFLAWIYFNTGSVMLDLETTLGGNYAIFMGFLLLLAPVSKSAQFPLQSWLSSGDTVDIDAMQGPTTVSALIHAATMVKAGVYLVARFTPIWDVAAFYITLMILAGISCVGAAFGALVTTDLKRVLAYSTISQLSYMFLALSMHEVGLLAGQLHLFSHAIFKALLFLSAGAIIHSLADERDIKKMGGLRKELPWIYWFMLIGVLGLIGLPIITNGGYSKELIIGVALEEALHANPMYWFVFIIAVLTAFLTALYSARMFFMIFHGENRGVKVHKPKWIMRTTLGILAFLVIFTAFTVEGVFYEFLKADVKAFGNPFGHLEWVPLVIALVTILLGGGLAYLLYGKGQTEVAFVENSKPFKSLRTFIAEGFYMDHLYNLVFVKPVFWIGKQFSYLKTGKINWNMILGGLVAIIALVILVVIV